MATTPTTAEQLDRLYQLCGVLQDYRESVTRLEDAERQDEARQRLLCAREAGLLIGGDQDAGQNEREANYTRDMVRRLDSALDNWTPLVNEFFRLAILNRLEIMSPAFGQIETTRRMPHRIGAFDWLAFSDELRAVRHEVLRLMDTTAEGDEVAQHVALDPQFATVEPGDPKFATEVGTKLKAPKTEGAVSQGVFVYKGRRAENIPPAPWRLLEFMEAKSESDCEEAYQYAIDEHDKDSTPGAIKGMIFKANQALLEVQHPKQLSKPKGVRKIVWV